MKLKESSQTPWLLIAVKEIWRNRSWRIVGVLLYGLLVFALGAYVHRAGFVSVIKTLATENVSLVPRWVRGRFARPEHITIDIQYEDMMKLAHKRQAALASGILVTSPDDYVPAQIRYKDQTIDVRLRLKGDLEDHWKGDKWSFRVLVRGDNALFGMKRFSIQHPATRRYIYEWLYHRALEREGVLSLRYEFIDVTINGKDMGIYALEEHFEKRLVEHNERREGPIVRFNEDLMWEAGRDGSQMTASGSYLSSDVDAFQTETWLADPATRRQYLAAVQTLESFRRGNLTTSEAFDVEKLAKFYALSDLLGAVHGAWNWANARFYHNPITGRLEPIGFDAYHYPLVPIEALIPTYGFFAQTTDDYLYITTLFDDRELYEQYIKELERMSQPSYLDDLFAELNDDMERNLSIIYKEFPGFRFTKGLFYENQRYIRAVLDPPKALHAYFRESADDHIELELAEIQYLPVQVIDVSYQDSFHFQPDGEVVLPEKNPLQPLDYRNVSFVIPDGLVWSDDMIPELQVNHRILGTSQVRSETVFPWTYLADDFAETDFVRQDPNVHTFEFLATDESSNRIFMKPGVWDLDQSLIIPKGYRVIAGEGTQLNLSDSAKILSYSPLEFVGSADDPIVIRSTDSSGQGVVVMSAGQTSVLKYVTFDNLSNPSQSGWELTGAVTFYEAPVQISHCQFVGSRSEDALNIVRSEFTMDETLFSQTLFDALDADFAKGRIAGSSFVACGNDAVDVSGSVMELVDIFVDGAGDKGLSAGENSRMTVRDAEIRNAAIAVASKDLSQVTISDVLISDGDVGLTAYQKKPEFGPGSLDAQGLEILRTEVPYLVEFRSTVVVDGAVIEASRENVADILYGVEYGRSSD